MTSGGGSLRMWAEYFPKAAIIGVDIYRKNLKLPARVRILQGRQTDGNLLESLCNTYNDIRIIIDDASHVSRNVISTFKTMFPCLANGGN